MRWMTSKVLLRQRTICLHQVSVQGGADKPTAQHVFAETVGHTNPYLTPYDFKAVLFECAIESLHNAELLQLICATWQFS